MQRLIRFLILTFISMSTLADTNLGPDLELVCPCSYTSASSSSALVGFGVTNRGTTATGKLLLRTYAHTEENYRDAVSPQFVGDIFLTESLAAGTDILTSKIQAGLDLPSAGSYYITFLLLNDQVSVDETRTSGQITIEDSLATTTSGFGLFFVADPSISINGSTLTLNMPGIGNSGASTTPIEVRVIATSTPKFVSQFVTLSEYANFTEIASRATTPAEVVDLTFTDPGDDFPFYHVLLLGNGFVDLVHTVRSEGAVFNTLSFEETSVDYLTDTDGDGVADDNERLMGTLVGSASSTPDASVVDILAVYNAKVASVYAGDPTARIDQIFAVANKALTDSNVDVQFRVSGYRQIGFPDTASLNTLLNDAGAQSGVFAGLQQIRTDTGSDLIAIFTSDSGGDLCGLASLGGFPTQGLMSRKEHISANIIEFDACNDLTMVHEVGHNMGLGHSFKQNETGTFNWSRGHGVVGSFSTLMGYADEFSVDSEQPYFSSPDVSLCSGSPCGIAVGNTAEADSARSLQAVRFQVANYTAQVLADSDADGVSDSEDAFPNDAKETIDTDGDGTGNNADTDDDGDTIPDSFELANNLDPLKDDAAEDPDGDGLTNLQEFNGDTDPQVFDVADVCTDSGVTAPLFTDSSLTFEKRLVMANPGSNTTQQTFLRFINANVSQANVEIYGIDDSGAASKREPVSFVLEAGSSKQITAQDLENGNANKGLTSTLCDLQGKWQLVVRSDDDIDIMGLIRTPDGFLTGLSEVVPIESGTNRVYFANPATNTNQQTFLRIANQSSSPGSVSIGAIDDTGATAGGTVTFDLAANASKQLTSANLENGSASKGLTGALGSGSGKWQLQVTSALDLGVLSLIRTSDGFLTNLSGVVPEDAAGNPTIYFANPATETTRATFIRVTNASQSMANVTISGIDDAGNLAPNGDVTFTLDSEASKQMLVSDLEIGNANKGLNGSLGKGEGRWRLTVASAQSLRVMSLVRTPDGFLTNLSSLAPSANLVSEVLMMNPGGNTNQQSSVRVSNATDSQAAVTISAVDDAGTSAPGGDVTFNLGAGSSVTITSAELEDGRGDLVGALGDGVGKWYVTIAADADLKVQSLLNAPGGFLTNLSSGVQ
jgi:hypothetical protein